MSRPQEKIPSNEACREAHKKAFDSRYDSGDFIEDINEDDMRDMLRKIWLIRVTPMSYGLDKYFSIMEILDAVAERKCTAYADDNWSDHLGG